MSTLKDLVRLLLVLAALGAPMMAQAQIRLYVPDDIDPPFYANLAQGFTPNDNVWAVVFFYRSPQCIPADFNLLDFVDLSGSAIACPLHIEGSTTWRSLSDEYPASNVFTESDEVPTWFVRWTELQPLLADDVLTITELAAASSLVTGSATSYHESVRNDIRGVRGGNSSINATGTISDGRTFQVEFTEKFRDEVHTFPHMRIEFR